ncbi:MAG TPA: hypothetical protein PLK28_11910 [Candidatus Rifleibacterium sp.]|nr:hypothetical protein [Candidatus Rifleibacterium sp.]HQB83219.1 hypothetical protein [Candidatus Rifleibacterium sp.]
MKNVRLGMLVAGFLVVGGTVFVSSSFAGTDNSPGLQVVRHDKVAGKTLKTARTVKPVQAANAAEDKIVLVAPPGELTPASSRMVTSLKPVVPTNVKHAGAATGKVARAASPAGAATDMAGVAVKPARAAKAEVAQAPAMKTDPKNLFTLVRLLNYAPHPLTEELLKHAPLTMNGNNYWFSIKYDEDWKVFNDDDGVIKGISFEIDVMENNKKVRSLKTPKVAIDATKIKKGQVLGIAEVAPYKFTIKVEEVTKNKKGVSELVFKLDLLG